ncbi:hypothetical protein L9F63_015317 [Diploptera punctata]|uniref:Uncharacterized protein n=1 Tax=Diploptera punctata TaxID=6984 RepID=A0AAD8A5U4_DIPPU|nr:hypothetical protein L9F63_015317 [Diploptera punctata]
MAPVASKLSSKLKSWVKIDDSFTTDGDVVLCQACNNLIVNSSMTCVMLRLPQMLYLNILDGKEFPTPFLISSKTLEHANHATVARFVNDGLKVFKKIKYLSFIVMLRRTC